MNTATRIAGFLALLLLVFASAAFAGARLDPAVEEPETGETEHMSAGAGAHAEGDHGSGGQTVPGLAVAEAGYRLVVPESRIAPGATSRLEFTVVDEAGQPVRDFDLTHERRLHLIVVRSDFQAFQHLHPAMGPDGSWSTAIDARRPGTYRMFADFSVAGTPLTLGADLYVPGEFEPRPLSPSTSTAAAGDGYEVAIDAPRAAAGATVETEFEVRRQGRPVPRVEPYLGADGHLVALREGDQAFLHTHPEGEPGGTGPIRFGVTYPTAGRYRLYFQFRHGGKVRTAEFTRIAGAAGSHESENHGH